MLTIGTTHRPATDLGYLLVKHPDRVHELELPTGRAFVCFPEAAEARCTAALVLEVGAPDRHGAPDGFTLGRFVNDRPYAASSLLSAALNKAFRTAMAGRSKDRPELAATAIPLEIHIPVLRCRGGADLASRLFAPLRYDVDATAIPLDDAHPDWGESPYVDLRLNGTLRLADALHHLYVLLPVLDDAKHYWVSTDEIDKLVRAGEGWLAAHPERELIVRRYLAHRRALSEPALERLAEKDDRVVADSVEDGQQEEDTPSLSVTRRETVLRVLRERGAQRVLDLGCGPGALLADLMADRRFTEIVGVDIASRSLAMAARRLRLDRPGAIAERDRERVRLLQSALTYRDARLAGYDAAVLMEVIEHVDEDRLPALVRSVFGAARPGTVLVTTPNAEYNSRYEGLTTGAMRHADHRFEWTRAQFDGWAAGVAAAHGYEVAIEGVGAADADLGAPTQLAVFTAMGGTDG